MIKLVRVDHRLLHGQVAFSWTNGVGADCILVASDSVVNDDVWKTTLKLGKPSGCKLVIKDMKNSIEAINSGVTDKYKLIIVVQSIAEAQELVNGCPSIQSINLGNTKEEGETRALSKQIFVTPKEEEILRSFIDKGLEVEIRPLVDDKKILVKNVL
ncbi:MULTISPECIES: PTS sugar transporter subunit IIB [unclassified Breznakia]|uniref:PTS sugar transporter subunit IIB n=1 Tax=unclassified Breznakia TaxID=2623764 RepID=UPI0024739B43|nr:MULTISPECIES: PTS sugar transporter subunit IIB [unclassified Breznakia]MDH6367948.1 fructoselysine and glucoselysine-specific PTS system IIB component [Breznakia sp. PH1-1]MDH6405036.1 fructoselysine and glucoselysine-specific PTS system IIB component [Breznakia sp. PF1-11]MDH6412751.1 fructoselysine and glucoselysine-specific PTS system IIB component [Breznakia sp. PFB1-11]MDH6415112.1 fructoselysine and glucoselysine-specific PTS system IIB component [Breznakia sp. PFB1-14]MDH6417422.1 f